MKTSQINMKEIEKDIDISHARNQVTKMNHEGVIIITDYKARSPSRSKSQDSQHSNDHW